MPSKFTGQQIWRHNGAAGQARFIEVSARTISTLSTATPTAKAIAAKIADMARALGKELKERDE